MFPDISDRVLTWDDDPPCSRLDIMFDADAEALTKSVTGTCMRDHYKIAWLEEEIPF